MKSRIFIAAALFTVLFTVSCGDKDKDKNPVVDPEYFTRDGVTKPIADAAFYYSEGGGCEIYLSPEKIAGKEVYEMFEWISICIPEEFLGKEIDLATDNLEGERWDLYIEYNRGFYQDIVASYGITRHGTVKVTKGEGNYFEVELNNLWLNDGASLSCRAARVINTKYDSYYGTVYYAGETSFSYEGATYAVAYLYPLECIPTPDGNYTTTIRVRAENDNEDRFEIIFDVNTDAPELSSGTYSFSENRGDKTFTESSSLSSSVRIEDNMWMGFSFVFTAGTFDLETSDYQFKLTLNSDLTLGNPEKTVPAATFTFDHADAKSSEGPMGVLSSAGNTSMPRGNANR